MNVERPIRQRALAEMLNGDLGIYFLSTAPSRGASACAARA
jgi:hypothetical protein